MQVNPHILTITAMSMIMLAGIAYIIFLAYTWRQLQADRSERYSRVDALLDRAAEQAKSDDA